MIRMGATGSPAHLDLCRALETVFRRNGVEFDWVLYSGYDEMVDAFTRGEINLAWNGPLSHVKMRRALPDGAPVLALRDVDIGFTTRFITRSDSAIDTVEDLPGTRFAFAARDSVEAGLLPVYFLKEMGIHPSRYAGGRRLSTTNANRYHASDQVDVALQVLNRSYDAGSHQRARLRNPGRAARHRHQRTEGVLEQPGLQPLLLHGAARGGSRRGGAGYGGLGVS